MSPRDDTQRKILRLLFSSLEREWAITDSQREELLTQKKNQQRLEARILGLRLRLAKAERKLRRARRRWEELKEQAPRTPAPESTAEGDRPEPARPSTPGSGELAPRAPQGSKPEDSAPLFLPEAQAKGSGMGSDPAGTAPVGEAKRKVDVLAKADGRTADWQGLEPVRINRKGFKELRVKTDRRVCIWVPGGTTLLGDESSHAMEPEKPAHAVCLAPYFFDKHPVSNQAYSRFLEVADRHDRCHPSEPAGKSHVPDHWESDEYARVSPDPLCPVVFVDWFDAYAYLKWSGRRMPTEAEWEYAARGRRRFHFPWGNTAPDESRANYFRPKGRTSAVGSHPKGSAPCGAQDVAGNVWEWVFDWMAPYRKAQEPKNNPRGPAEGELKIIRGGSWSSPEDSCRGSFRNWCLPLSRGPNIGIRGAISAK